MGFPKAVLDARRIFRVATLTIAWVGNSATCRSRKHHAFDRVKKAHRR